MKSLGFRITSAALAFSLAAGPLAAARADDNERERGRGNNPMQNVPVTGTTDAGDAFAGTLDIQRFQVVGNTLVAVGELTGKAGNRNFKRQAVAIPVQVTSGGGASAPKQGLTVPAAWHGSAGLPGLQKAQLTCPVLHLNLGPLDLNLLGLVVHLNQVVLNIDAQAGPGNLLGNLLCAVAGLLDPLQLLALGQLLNQVTNLLNGIGL